LRHAAANPLIGSRLGPLLHDAGLTGIETFGIQRYLAPDDPSGPALISGVVNSLAPVIIAGGIATEDELGLDTLRARIAAAVRHSRAVVLPPTVVGAWGRAADG
jgi:hypothetical protein